MGCGNSKQKRCRHCQSPLSPVRRGHSMNVHHLPQSKGDSYHVVALTSTSWGSIKIDSTNKKTHPFANDNVVNGDEDHMNGEERSKANGFSMGLIEAKTWSNMIEEKIPKIVSMTPTRTPPGEPETINSWELMEGLEDTSPLHLPNHIRSFSFDVVRNPIPASGDPLDRPKSRFQDINGSASPKPMWLHIADDDSISKSIEFDPEVISSFRKALEELNPDNPFRLRPLDDEKQQAKACNEYLSPFDANDAKKAVNGQVLPDYKCGKDKLVVYFTSLRGVRKTYEDCCHVRVILKGIGVRVDERDVSMHSGFKDELKELLDDGFNGGGLPRVFVGKKYIGGADEIRQMHEEGQLEKLLQGCEMVDDGDAGGGGNGVTCRACEACGDIRFVPCETCSGSCKVYYEGDDDEEEECEDGVFGFQRCPDCNENGLIRCPICCH
ncbi:Glutaredoxin domain-containing protein [Cephalotus follicularis]|uniref:Glutaredoxin domain-containing protein n=1 Tax=Cephalotus follicularis TaxID=3775 RepID=A0A1Q3CRQ7_CEPFO|nr:Glutaredoxin domain-containing protein [Cephalotus follicularis]